MEKHLQKGGNRGRFQLREESSFKAGATTASVNPMGSFGAGMTLQSCYKPRWERFRPSRFHTGLSLELSLPWKEAQPWVRQFSSNQDSCPKRADHPSSHTPRGSWSKSFIPKGRPAAHHSIHYTVSTVWPKVTHLPRPQVHPGALMVGLTPPSARLLFVCSADDQRSRMSIFLGEGLVTPLQRLRTTSPRKVRLIQNFRT